MSNIANTSVDSSALTRQSNMKFNGTPPNQGQGAAGAAVCYGNHIQYAMPDGDNYLTIITNDLAPFQSSFKLKDLNHFNCVAAADSFPTAMKDKFKVFGFISIVSMAGYNYIFWANKRDDDSQPDRYVLRTRPDMQTPPVMARIDLSNADFILKSNLAAFLLPNTSPALADKLGAVGLGFRPSTGTYELVPLILDPAEFKPDSPWVPTLPNSKVSVNNILASDLWGASLVNYYNYISADLYDQGTYLSSEQGNQEANGAPRNYIQLVVNCRSAVENTSRPACVSFSTDALEVFDAPHVDGQQAVIVPAVPVAGFSDIDASTSATITHAPDGTLVATYEIKDGSKIENVFFRPSNNTAVLGLHNPSWQQYTPPFKLDSEPRNTPCTVFVPLLPSTGPSPCLLNNVQGEMVTYPDCRIQNYVMCVFTSVKTAATPIMLTYYWGCLFNVPGYREGTMSQTQRDSSTVLSMVADTFPVPVPHPEVWGPDSPSGMVNWALCNYEYLVGNNTEVQIDNMLRGTIGRQGEANALVLGVGVAYEYSLKTGITEFTSQSDTVRRATSLSISTKGLPFSLSGQEGEAPPELSISPSGALFGAAPPATIYMDLSLVLRNGETQPTQTLAAVPRPLFDSSVMPIAGEYNSYCYTPGNLLSYTETEINLRMAGLYNDYKDTLAQNSPNRFVINGVDYGILYAGTDSAPANNYLANVVERFGVKAFGPGGNQPYLEFSFSETGVQRSDYQSTSGFTTGSSFFVDGSFYAGGAWDQQISGGVGALGVVEISINLLSTSGFDMIGAEIYSEMTTTNTSSTDWGIRLDEFLNPLAPGESYTVRMYLLKPSPLWGRELECFGALTTGTMTTTADTTNSSPVRILFTVPYISAPLAARLTSKFGSAS